MTLKNRIHKVLLAHPILGFWVYELVRLFKNVSGFGASTSTYYRLKHAGFEPSTIFDIGANRAEWSRDVKRVFPNATFVLFEPQFEMVPFLKRFTEDFPDSHFEQAALGAESGTAEIEIWGDFAGTTMMFNKGDKPTREIKVLSVDHLLSLGTTPPDCMKIDVQGFELEVLSGAESCLGTTEVIVLEVALYELNPGQPDFKDVISFMDSRGYLVFDFHSLKRDKVTKKLRYMDVVFVKSDSVLRWKR